MHLNRVAVASATPPPRSDPLGRPVESARWPYPARGRRALVRWVLVRCVIAALAFLSVSIPLTAMPGQALRYWYLYYSPVMIAALSFGVIGAVAASVLTTATLASLFDRAGALARAAAEMASHPGQSLEQLNQFAAGLLPAPPALPPVQSISAVQWSFRSLLEDAVLGMALTTGISCLVGWLVDENRRQLARYQALAGTDPLTGIGNYHRLMERLDQQAASPDPNDRPFAYLMIDLDGLKAFNDSHGHLAGDDVLRRVAGLLHSGARSADTVARYGGDEFALVMPDTDEEGAWAAAERLRSAVAQHFAAGDGDGRPEITLSVGVAVYPTHGTNPSRLVQAADDALYEAKLGGKDRVVLASLPAGGPA